MRNVVYLYHRGGVLPIGRIDGITSVQWDRRRDDVSEVRINAEDMSAECCQMLANARVVLHEIVVFRDGERVWEGPVTLIQWHTNGATIAGRDMLFYAQRTVCKKQWDSSYDKVLRPKGETTVSRIGRIMKSEMVGWDAAGARFLQGLDLRDNADVAHTTKKTYAYAQYVWEDMDAMAERSGLDYTVVRRRLIIHDTHQFIGMGRQITNDDITEDMEISQYGVELAVRYYATDNIGGYGVASHPDPWGYGPVELVSGAYGDGAENAQTSPVAPVKPTVPLRSNYPTAAQRARLEKQHANNASALAAALASYARNYTAAVAQYSKDLATYNAAMKKYLPVLEKYLKELREQAERNIRGRYPAPTQIRVPQNSTLTPEAVESLWDWLVPGTGFMVYSDNTCYTLEQEQKLDKVQVYEDASGEKVSISMSNAPIGSGVVIDATTLGGNRVEDVADIYGITSSSGYGYDENDPDEVALFADLAEKE